MGDLTLQSFAYFKLPLLLAVIAFGVIAEVACLRFAIQQRRAVLAVAAGMIIFFQARASRSCALILILDRMRWLIALAIASRTTD